MNKKWSEIDVQHYFFLLIKDQNVIFFQTVKHTRIVDKIIYLRLFLQDGRGKPPHRLLFGQLQGSIRHVVAPGALLDLLDSRLGFLGIAAADDDLSAATSEIDGGVLADAGVATCR